jgi:hypothetical protein
MTPSRKFFTGGLAFGRTIPRGVVSEHAAAKGNDHPQGGLLRLFVAKSSRHRSVAISLLA